MSISVTIASADMLAEGLAEHAKRPRRGDDDEVGDLLRLHRLVEAGGERLQELLLVAIVPVGLLDPAPRRADALMHPAGTVGAERAGRGVLGLERAPGAQVRIFLVADVLEDDRLPSVADHDPRALPELQFHRLYPSC